MVDTEDRPITCFEETMARLRAAFPDAKITVAIYDDIPYGGNAFIEIRVLTALDVGIALDTLDKFDEWWLDNRNRLPYVRIGLRFT